MWLSRPRHVVAVLVVLAGGCGSGSRGSGAGDRRPWKAVTLDFDTDIRDVFFLDENQGWVVGGENTVRGGLIAVTRDGGASWRVETNVVKNRLHPERYSFYAVRFVDGERGWVGGDDGIILRTVDGGRTWETQRTGHGPEAVLDLFFLDRDTGWASTSDGILWTTDGGEAWHGGRAMSREGTGELNLFGCAAVQFADARTGFVVSHHGILKSTDGGRRWDFTSAPELAFAGLHFLSPLVGWAVGEGGTIVRTRDGGATWETQKTGLNLFPLLRDVKFVDEQHGYVVGFVPRWNRSMILYTENGGESWSLQQDVEGYELEALDLLDAAHAWTAGERVVQGPLKLMRLAP